MKYSFCGFSFDLMMLKHNHTILHVKDSCRYFERCYSCVMWISAWRCDIVRIDWYVANNGTCLFFFVVLDLILARFSSQPFFATTAENIVKCEVINMTPVYPSLKYRTNTGNTKGRYLSIYSADIKMDVPRVIHMTSSLLWFFVWSLSHQSPLKVNSRWGNGGRCYSNNIIKYESVESWLVLKGNDLVCDYGISWLCMLMQARR